MLSVGKNYVLHALKEMILLPLLRHSLVTAPHSKSKFSIWARVSVSQAITIIVDSDNATNLVGHRYGRHIPSRSRIALATRNLFLGASAKARGDRERVTESNPLPTHFGSCRDQDERAHHKMHPNSAGHIRYHHKVMSSHRKGLYISCTHQLMKSKQFQLNR